MADPEKITSLIQILTWNYTIPDSAILSTSLSHYPGKQNGLQDLSPTPPQPAVSPSHTICLCPLRIWGFCSSSLVFGIYRWCQAVIPIFDILISFGVMAERLNPYVGIFRFLRVFDPPAPHTQKFKMARQKPNVYGFGGFVKILLKSFEQIRRIFAKKRRKNKSSSATRDLKS